MAAMDTARWSLFAGALATALLGACSAERLEPPGATASASTDGDADRQDPSSPDGGAPTTSSAAVPACTTDLEAELTRLAVPGISVGIVKGGKIACLGVAGQANLEEKRAVTRDTVFLWASVSKTVTAVTLMSLFDEGKLTLDGDVDAHLPFAVTIPGCPTKPVTFRHLLTHTSSIIEDDEDGLYADSYVNGDSPVALGDFLRSYLVPGQPGYDASANFEPGCPGTTATYSNVGAGLIGYLAEQIAGTPFDQLARKRVFEPLGMNETSFRLAGLDRSHLAMPYELERGKRTPAGHFGFATYPDGLVRSSAPQMARFLLMFMRKGELDGTRILAAKTVEEMTRIQLPAVDPAQGLIWFHTDVGGRHLVGHDGSDPGVSSNLFYDPADGSGVVMVANGEWDEDAGEALMARLFEESKRY